MNGDNSPANDLIYVPKNAHDANEIRFSRTARRDALTPAQQADSLESIHQAPRVPRLAARHDHAAQLLPHAVDEGAWTSRPVSRCGRSRAQNFILQLDVFNFLNLLNKNWGAQDLGSTNSPALLTRRSVRAATAGQPLKIDQRRAGVFNFTTSTSSRRRTSSRTTRCSCR